MSASGSAAIVEIVVSEDVVADRPIRSQYENFARHVFAMGAAKQDRTGTGTVSVFGYQTVSYTHLTLPTTPYV